MNKKTSEKDNTIIISDEYLSESGVQGGKITAEKLELGCFIFGIPFLIIGLWSIFNDIIFGKGFHLSGIAMIVSPPVLVIIMGLLLIIGGYYIYRDKHVRK